MSEEKEHLFRVVLTMPDGEKHRFQCRRNHQRNVVLDLDFLFPEAVIEEISIVTYQRVGYAVVA